MGNKIFEKKKYKLRIVKIVFNDVNEIVSIFCFFFQCVLLGVRTIHVMLRYAIHLYDTRGAGTSSPRSWDKRGPLAYYTELASELTVLAVEFLHHIHMLLWSNIFLSMASLVICMQLRYLFYEIQRRITKHRNYLAVLSHMEQKSVYKKIFSLLFFQRILVFSIFFYYSVFLL